MAPEFLAHGSRIPGCFRFCFACEKWVYLDLSNYRAALWERILEKQDISNLDIDWAGLVRHVTKDQVAVEFTDGLVAIAQLIPVKKSVSMKDFASIMATIPSLGEDAESFARDVESVRSSFKETSDPWEL